MHNAALPARIISASKAKCWSHVKLTFSYLFSSVGPFPGGAVSCRDSHGQEPFGVFNPKPTVILTLELAPDPCGQERSSTLATPI